MMMNTGVNLGEIAWSNAISGYYVKNMFHLRVKGLGLVIESGYYEMCF